MTEAIPDPYDPSWIGGPYRRAEDEAYLFAKQRKYQEEQIADRHALLVLKAKHERAVEQAALIVLAGAADGAHVRKQVARMVEMEGGAEGLIDAAIRLIRLLGADHRDDIAEIVDAMRRVSEGEW